MARTQEACPGPRGLEHLEAGAGQGPPGQAGLADPGLAGQQDQRPSTGERLGRPGPQPRLLAGPGPMSWSSTPHSVAQRRIAATERPELWRA